MFVFLAQFLYIFANLARRALKMSVFLQDLARKWFKSCKQDYYFLQVILQDHYFLQEILQDHYFLQEILQDNSFLQEILQGMQFLQEILQDF